MLASWAIQGKSNEPSRGEKKGVVSWQLGKERIGEKTG
jgi:hypothetical protein